MTPKQKRYMEKHKGELRDATYRLYCLALESDYSDALEVDDLWGEISQTLKILEG